MVWACPRGRSWPPSTTRTRAASRLRSTWSCSAGSTTGRCFPWRATSPPGAFRSASSNSWTLATTMAGEPPRFSPARRCWRCSRASFRWRRGRANPAIPRSITVAPVPGRSLASSTRSPLRFAVGAIVCVSRPTGDFSPVFSPKRDTTFAPCSGMAWRATPSRKLFGPFGRPGPTVIPSCVLCRVPPLPRWKCPISAGEDRPRRADLKLRGQLQLVVEADEQVRQDVHRQFEDGHGWPWSIISIVSAGIPREGDRCVERRLGIVDSVAVVVGRALVIAGGKRQGHHVAVIVGCVDDSQFAIKVHDLNRVGAIIHTQRYLRDGKPALGEDFVIERKVLKYNVGIGQHFFHLAMKSHVEARAIARERAVAPNRTAGLQVLAQVGDLVVG